MPTQAQDYAAITRIAAEIRFDNASKGFDPLEGGIDRYLLLAVSEICEAQEELRDGRAADEVYYSDHGKPEGFPVEIADALIRLMDIAARLKIDIGAVIGRKLAYNRTRPPKHGRQF